MSKHRPVELVIFDCDGVLIDSEPLSARTFSHALARAGFPLSEEEVHQRFTGYAETDARAILAAERPDLDIEALFTDARAMLFDAFRTELKPIAGIEDVVRALPTRLCVASNSDIERLRNSLGLLPLWSAFDPHVYSAEMTQRPKPAPDLLELCMARLQTDAARTLMVDDSPQGIAAAVAAGVGAIGFIAEDETRPARAQTLRDAGAITVATGAAELSHQLSQLIRIPPTL